MLSIRLPKDLQSRLDLLCEMTRRTKSFFVKEALQNYLDDLEDAYIALERITQRKRKFYTTEELMASLEKRK